MIKNSSIELLTSTSRFGLLTRSYTYNSEGLVAKLWPNVARATRRGTLSRVTCEVCRRTMPLYADTCATPVPGR